MTAPATHWHKFCNTCQKQVFELDHKRHVHILLALGNADVPGNDDLFVHQMGGPDNFDEDYIVVVCDHCFIAELADGLLLAPLSG